MAANSVSFCGVLSNSIQSAGGQSQSASRFCTGSSWWSRAQAGAPSPRWGKVARRARTALRSTFGRRPGNGHPAESRAFEAALVRKSVGDRWRLRAVASAEVGENFLWRYPSGQCLGAESTAWKGGATKRSQARSEPFFLCRNPNPVRQSYIWTQLTIGIMIGK